MTKDNDIVENKKNEDEDNQEDEKPVAKLIAISGLWLNEDKDGNPYFTGYMGNARIWIFKNKFKTDEKHPDYTLSIGENKKKTGVSKDDIKF